MRLRLLHVVLFAGGLLLTVRVGGLRQEISDGAGRISTLLRIVFPLALPGIVVAAILAWLDSWNDLLWAIYLLPSEFTLPRLTYYYAARGGFFDVATFSVLLTIPVFFITLFLQRYIRTGYLSGAVKG